METSYAPEPSKHSMLSNLDRLMKSAQDTKNPEVDLTGGLWDAKKRMYTHTDTDGITTEYKLRRAPAVEHGNTVMAKSYRTENGVRTEVQFNSSTGMWEPRLMDTAKKTIEWAMKAPRHVAKVIESHNPDGSVSHSLHIEPYKIKGIPRSLTTPIGK